MNRGIKIGLQVILIACIVGLSYMLYDSIMQPIRFEKQYKKRYQIVVERLKDIRNAQVAFKNNYGHYTADFDSLITFVKSDSLKIVRKFGSVPDSIAIMYTKEEAEKKALEYGIIRRDTVKISIIDSLFPPPYKVDSMKYVPYSGGESIFEMDATVLATLSGVNVPVFEVKAHNDIFLKGLDRQQVVNLNDEAKQMDKYPGLKVGSLTEVTNNAGNWED